MSENKASAMPGGKAQQPSTISLYRLILWIVAVWITRNQNSGKKPLQPKYDKSENHQLTQEEFSGELRRVISLPFAVTLSATRYLTPGILNTVHDGYRVPWNIHQNIIKKINHNQSRIDCKNYRTHCRNEWSLRTEQNSKNNDHEGNKKSEFKFWKCTKWKYDTNYRSWKRLRTIATEPRTYTTSGNFSGENWEWETTHNRYNRHQKLHARILHISRTRASYHKEICITETRNTQNNNLRPEKPLYALTQHRYIKEKAYSVKAIILRYDRRKARDMEDETDKKRMRHESGEETKGTGPQEAGYTQDVRKPTALNYHEHMQQGWQMRADWPDVDTLVQTMVTATAEKGVAIRATLRGVISRMRDRPDDPAAFLVYRDWARSLHPSLSEHKDVHILVCTFCSCIRGLWIQREHKLKTQMVAIIREVIITEAGTDTWNQIEMSVRGQLEQTVEWITRQYTQEYESLMTAIPPVYQPLARAEYKDNETDAFHKIQGKIAIFKTLQTQTPTKMTTKEAPKAAPNISFINDIPEMFSSGIEFPARDPIPRLTNEELQQDHEQFNRYKHCSTTAPIFENEAQQQILETMSRITLTADESFGRSQCILLIGVSPWTTEATAEQNKTNNEVMLEHIIGRLGFQNESPHFASDKYNGINPSLGKAGYEYVFERDDNKIGTMMIELVTPVLFGSVSTLVEGTDGPGILGEVQRIYVKADLCSNKKGAGKATVFAQMMPYIRLTELRKDESTPLLGCIKGMPTGANANSLSGACLHAVRRWLNETMHFDPEKYILMLDAMWHNPPRAHRNTPQRAAALLPFIKIVFTGNSGRRTGRNDDEYRQYQEALLSRTPNWLIHVGGFRLELCCTTKEVKEGHNHQWLQEKTPCALIKPIRAGLTARDILYCLFDRAWGNRAALHNIRGIHMLPRTGFGFDAGDMKYYDDACIVIFLNEPYTLDITSIIQRFGGKEIRTTKVEDLPGRTQIVDVGGWHPIIPNGGSDIRLGGSEISPVYRSPDAASNASDRQTTTPASYIPSPISGDANMMEIDTGGLGASRRNTTKDTGEITQYDKLNSVISRLLMDHEALHTTQISATMALEDLGKQMHESQRRHQADLQDLQENHTRDLLELRQHQEELVRSEITMSFQQMTLRAEHNQRLLHLEATLRQVFDKYDAAAEAHLQAVSDLGQLTPGIQKSKEMAAQKEVDRLGRLMGKQETALDIARGDYEQHAISGGVDPSPLLSRYVRQ